MTPPSRPPLDEFAAGQIDATDLDVLAHLRGMYETLDPVPAELVDRIQFGITLDALHAEVAELQRSDTLAGVRADDTSDTQAAQTITFTSAKLTTMITIAPADNDRVRLDGWVAPGGGVVVDLRIGEQTLGTEADANGRFVFESVPHGFARFVLRPPGDDPRSVVVTPSIEI